MHVTPRSAGCRGPLFPASLLFTSDAADDLTRVDLGGRRLSKIKHTHFEPTCYTGSVGPLTSAHNTLVSRCHIGITPSYDTSVAAMPSTL